jgi:hypothetical protein
MGTPDELILVELLGDDALASFEVCPTPVLRAARLY